MYDKVTDLPAPVRKLSEDLQRQWLEVFNSVLKDHPEDEERAFASAWAVVNEKKLRALTLSVKARNAALVLKGAPDGHEFYGNQFTGGKGGPDKDGSDKGGLGQFSGAINSQSSSGEYSLPPKPEWMKYPVVKNGIEQSMNRARVPTATRDAISDSANTAARSLLTKPEEYPSEKVMRGFHAVVESLVDSISWNTVPGSYSGRTIGAISVLREDLGRKYDDKAEVDILNAAQPVAEAMHEAMAAAWRAKSSDPVEFIKSLTAEIKGDAATAKEIERKIRKLASNFKGAPVGHEFYGNQFAGGKGGSDGTSGGKTESVTRVKIGSDGTVRRISEKDKERYLDGIEYDWGGAPVRGPAIDDAASVLMRLHYDGDSKGYNRLAKSLENYQNAVFAISNEDAPESGAIEAGKKLATLTTEFQGKLKDDPEFEEWAGSVRSDWGSDGDYTTRSNLPAGRKSRVGDAATTKEIERKIRKLASNFKAAPKGHEFYGNQYTDGKGGPDKDGSDKGGPMREISTEPAKRNVGIVGDNPGEHLETSADSALSYFDNQSELQTESHKIIGKLVTMRANMWSDSSPRAKKLISKLENADNDLLRENYDLGKARTAWKQARDNGEGDANSKLPAYKRALADLESSVVALQPDVDELEGLYRKGR